MSAFRRLALPFAALVALGLLSAALPGRAQQAPSDRFAFADTTLLRDTLGLRFDGLFELADSLRMTPDTLRAISIRWLLPIERILWMADSMRVPVDSVGAMIDRERFNVLAIRDERVTDFLYTSGYNLVRTRSAWTNALDIRLVRNALFFSQGTTILLETTESARATTQRQTRRAANELGYRIGQNTSIGVRAVLDRFDSDDPSQVRQVTDETGQYQFSLRTKQDPRPGLSSEFNVFSGIVDKHATQLTKRGVDSEVNGRVVYESGTWLQNDWSGKVSGNFARTTPAETGIEQNTHDTGRELRTTFTMWPTSPMSLNTDLSYRDFRIQTPDDTGFVSERRNANSDVNATLRVRIDNDRSVSIQGGLSRSYVTLGTTGGSSESRGSNILMEGRGRLLGASAELRFRLGFLNSATPQLDTLGGYGEKAEDRGLEGVLTRQFMRQRLSTRATGRISLQRSRYYTFGGYTNLPVPRDVAAQSYRLEGTYTLSRAFNTTAGLEVTRQELVNLVSSSVGTNTLTRTYRADWTWTYRLVQALTITQRNTMLGNYVSYPYNSPADRLLLEYGNTTTLNAVLTPRFNLDLNHIAQIQPSGGYTIEASDGFYYFRPADETQTYSIGIRATYTPGPMLALTIEPRYRYQNRDGTNKGEVLPLRLNENLTFGGAANLNYPVGRRGRISGNISRLYTGDRNVGYKSGLVETVTNTHVDNWAANLQFTWRL